MFILASFACTRTALLALPNAPIKKHCFCGTLFPFALFLWGRALTLSKTHRFLGNCVYTPYSLRGSILLSIRERIWGEGQACVPIREWTEEQKGRRVTSHKGTYGEQGDQYLGRNEGGSLARTVVCGPPMSSRMPLGRCCALSKNP